MSYKPTCLELYVSSLLLHKGIASAGDLNISNLSKAFKINVKFKKINTFMLTKGKKTLIVVNNDLSRNEQYNQFLYELAYYIFKTTYNWKYFQLNVDSIYLYLSKPYFLNNGKKCS